MTDVALRDHLERMIHEMDRRIDQRFGANEEAVRKAETTMSARLAGMNEFRDALKDQASRMATRDELMRVDIAVQELQRAKANLEGRLIMLSGGISMAVSIVLWMFFGRGG